MSPSPDTPAADEPQPSLTSRTAGGAAWQFASGVSVRVVGFFATLLLTRFLAPADYGEVLLAAAAVIMAARFLTLGLYSYVIVHQSPPAEVFQAMVVHTGLTATGVLLVTALRDPVAQALGAPGMARYVPGLAIAIFTAQLSQIPAATLARALNFKVPAAARALGEVAYAAVSLGLAPFVGASAVVAGNLGRAAVASSVVFARAPLSLWWRPCVPDLPTLKRFLAFGLPVTGASVAETVSSYGDGLLVSRFHGPGTMAVYNLSHNVATTPTGYVTDQAGEVLLPGLAALHDPSRRRAAFLRAFGLVILIVTPLVFGLAAVSSTLVSAILDERWAGAAPMITILSGVGGGYMISCVTTPYLLSYRRAGTTLALAWVRTISMVVLMTTVGRAGPLWAAASASAAVGFTLLIVLVVVSRSEHIGLGALTRRAAPAVGAALVMAVGVAAARALWSGWGAPVALGLVLEVASGAIGYLAAAAALARPQVLDLAGIVRELHARRFRGAR